MAARVYVGGLRPDTTERELEDEFSAYGAIRSIWVARKPPGFAFVEFEDTRDAEDCVRQADGKHNWRVELSRRPPAGRRDDFGGPPRGRGELRCYECNEVGHLARDCRNKRRRSPSPGPVRRRDRRSESPPRGRRDRSPESPRRRRDSRSPAGRPASRSPAGRARRSPSRSR
eukprot:gene9284-9449_t